MRVCDCMCVCKSHCVTVDWTWTVFCAGRDRPAYDDCVTVRCGKKRTAPDMNGPSAWLDRQPVVDHRVGQSQSVTGASFGRAFGKNLPSFRDGDIFKHAYSDHDQLAQNNDGIALH
jgi:hypothetical protein